MEGDANVASDALKRIEEAAQVEVHGQEVTVSVRNGAALISSVALALDQRGIAVRELTLRTPTLDDVFLHITGERLHDGASEQAQAPSS